MTAAKTRYRKTVMTDMISEVNNDVKIREIIIVEGRDDTTAVKRSVDAVTIETHGYGISAATWKLIDKAYREKGIIVFTDPDHAGEQIRRRIMARYPDAGQAFLDRDLAEKAGDIGIENASPQTIRDALSKARYTVEESDSGFTMDDMVAAGLTGQDDAAQRRKTVGKILGIGYGNTGTFLKRLNKFNITEEELIKALREI